MRLECVAALFEARLFFDLGGNRFRIHCNKARFHNLKRTQLSPHGIETSCSIPNFQTHGSSLIDEPKQITQLHPRPGIILRCVRPDMYVS